MTDHPACPMQQFIQSCVFMHDDEDGPRAVNGEYQWRWNEYSSHSFLLGADACVIDSTAGYGDRYLNYLHELGCLPKTIIIPKYRQPSLVANLLADPTALHTLKEVLSTHKQHLSCLHFDREQEYLQLLKLLASDHHQPQRFPSKEGYGFANDKINARELFQRADIAVPEGAICSDSKELKDFYQYCYQKNFPVILKKGHWETQALQNPRQLDEMAERLVFPLIAERVYPVQSSPIIHCVTWQQQARALFAVDQIVENWKHYGNSSPCRNDAMLTKQLVAQSLRVLDYLPEFEGIWGVDFILSGNAVPLAVDLNPRFNASTYPYYLLQRLGLDFNRLHTRYRRIKAPIDHLGILFGDAEFVPFDRQKQQGILLIGPVFDAAIGRIEECYALIVGQHSQACDRLEQCLRRLVQKYRYHERGCEMN